MHYELTDELAKALVSAVDDYACDYDVALACGVTPATLTGWLTLGVRPDAGEPYRGFATRFAGAVAARRCRMQGDALEVEAKSAAGAGIHLKAAAQLTEAPTMTGPLGQAFEHAAGMQGIQETLESLLKGRDQAIVTLLRRLGLRLVDDNASLHGGALAEETE